MLDRRSAFGKYLCGTGFAQHGQRALDLMHGVLQGGQRFLAGGIAEEGIQGLFDGAEIGAYFACY